MTPAAPIKLKVPIKGDKTEDIDWQIDRQKVATKQVNLLWCLLLMTITENVNMAHLFICVH